MLPATLSHTQLFEFEHQTLRLFLRPIWSYNCTWYNSVYVPFLYSDDIFRSHPVLRCIRCNERKRGGVPLWPRSHPVLRRIRREGRGKDSTRRFPALCCFLPSSSAMPRLLRSLFFASCYRCRFFSYYFPPSSPATPRLLRYLFFASR